ncbi:MAG TPA: sodium-dependent transporter [Acidobacteriota bacterium]
MTERERWGTRIGLVLAAAGNAVGIGNLLRFPSQAAQNGGGAFIIPYFLSLLFFGLPMMWVAWTIGRFGGQFGHTSTPGMFDKLWKAPISKYLGTIGVALPLLFCLYYTYIESWCLAYSFFSLTGDYVSTPERYVDLAVYYNEFLGGAPTHSYFPGLNAALVFTFVTVLLNIWVLYRGVAKGIELLAKIAMPLLILFCMILAVRVFTLADGGLKGTVWDGLNFIFTPDFSALTNWNVWMAAAGQIFFTLSIGFGSIECFASYLRENDDVTLAGLTTASTNEFVEVIFGSAIAIPAAAIYFGPGRIVEIASGGSYAIGLVSMPEILRNLPGLGLFGSIWFLLLFFAAFTSSVAVSQPVVAFLQDEGKLPKAAAAGLVGIFWLIGTLPVIYFYKYGVFTEMDFWAGTIGLVVFAAIEAIVFSWIFGMAKGWAEMHRGAQFQVPRLFFYIIRYVTPVALLAILFGWYYNAISTNALIPTPQVQWGVAERHRYHGEFVTRAPAPGSPEAGEVQRIQDQIAQAVEEARRDVTAWADVRLGPNGQVSVVGFEADPRLRPYFSSADLEQLLRLQQFHFEPVAGQPGGEIEITIPLEGLNREPYIYMIRVVMLMYLLTFLLLTRALWQRRRAGH